MPPSTVEAVLRVVLPLPLPRAFDYLPPEGVAADTAMIGCRVRVPFGSREIVGFVDEVGASAEDAPELKQALAVLDGEPLLHGELLSSLRWAARYYHAPLGEVIATALPATLRNGEPMPETCIHGWALTEAGRTGWPGLRRNARTRAFAERIAHAPVDEDVLDAQDPGWRTAARALAKRGYAERLALPRSAMAEPASPSSHALNPAQRAAADAVLAARDRFQPLLLEGVTGSGKTEVYLEAIADCIAHGRQALVLVPEIGLTPQMLRWFRARLGVTIHALHSGLSDGERACAWSAMARGEARVLVGTRSAVFTPLPEAGLIVVDEEHDASYKQQEGMRYHARDLALVRGKALGVPVLLGSATPSLESLHHALAGRYEHLQLRQRAGDARPPSVRVLDVRKRALDGGLSKDALDAIAATLARGEQALVFRNRRGYAPVLLCHDCGWSARCSRCDASSKGIAMTVHGRGRTLICHHCGARRAVPKACPDCASLALHPQGSGTERIEETLAMRFPDATLLRVDRGTTRHRNALERHLDELGDRPGILVGTQMLAKGHDLPNLTLVCVVGVDEGLFSADFRAPEKLAQLLIQVAGRGGRAGKPGTVLLQTHHPEHPLLTILLGGGYPAFAALELAQREAAAFPPYGHLALLRAEAPDDAAVQDFLIEAKGAFATHATTASIHGPLPAPMPRRAGKARAQLHLSAARRPALQSALSLWMPQLHALKSARKVRWSLDVDPVDLY
ncbi:MAG TPA: primosomal protein N' [Xanthomonadaceae bacterium]|jgi:primosomal protein N' (replication factor Y)|nr:primosomal protein N' [Xanthomonadaceae bacterium]